MTKTDSSLTQEQLKELFHYDPETGIFTRIFRIAHCVHIGDIAGCLHSTGYIYIKIRQSGFKAHRLAWLYVYGKWPDAWIDHINGATSDNRIANLREASPAENSQNRFCANVNNVSGILGVRFRKTAWEARITIKGKVIQIGSFPTKELAQAAHLEAKRLYHPFCTI